MKRLRVEAWFIALEKDWRYGYILQNNTKVKQFIRNEKNLKMVLSMDEERDNFIHLVKEEHEKYTGLR